MFDLSWIDPQRETIRQRRIRKKHAQGSPDPYLEASLVSRATNSPKRSPSASPSFVDGKNQFSRHLLPANECAATKGETLELNKYQPRSRHDNLLLCNARPSDMEADETAFNIALLGKLIADKEDVTYISSDGMSHQC